MKIRITAGEVSLLAELNQSPTARMIGEALPFEGTAHTWGDEVYFEIPVEADLEPNARAEVEVGELGYWPVGRALCIFFGPTPISTDDQPKAYSPVNIVGRVLGDATAARGIRDGMRVRVERT
ncbi:MAG TPA: hypothetical protein EYP52_05245 [Anaerolineae bacterium]|nr:hypothetical protein [Anaerolineae bacterium]